jgi:hypothetical protein
MRVVKEVKWQYILMEDEGDYYLTFLSGGPVEIDYCVKLTPEERQRVEKDGADIQALIDELLADREKLHKRRIVPSRWPPKT